MDALSTIGTVASILGVSVKELITKRWIRKNPDDIGVSIIRLLSVFEGDDEIVGRWEVAKWSSRAHMEKPYFVSGHLSIFYKYPAEDRWKGVLSLTYNRDVSKFRGMFGVHTRYKRLRGLFFECLYDIDITRRGETYRATSAMTFRNPDIGVKYQGVFDELTLERSQLTGLFRNTTPVQYPEENETDVIFHQRKMWRELTASG
jgi:hypothetical protein